MLSDSLAARVGRPLLRAFSPGGRGPLSIMIYHRVAAAPDPLFPGEVDQQRFDREISFLKSHFTILPLADAIERIRSGTLPPRAACITFDDGYADNAEVALPILQHHGVHATFFIATGFLNGGRMWNDSVIELVRSAPGPLLDASALGLGSHAIESMEQRRAAISALIGQLKYLPLEERLARVSALTEMMALGLPDDLMMTTSQVLRLYRAGMGIGAHTVNHPILATLAPHRARAEIAEGKAALEAMISDQVRLFAYPNGKPGEDYLPEHVAMVRELGFEGAVSTAWGAHRAGTDLYQLPRFTPWDRSRLRFLLRLAHNLTVPSARA